MKKRLLSFITFRSFAVCLSASFMASIILAGTPAYAKDGRTVYEDHCIGCHGDKGDAKSNAAEDLLAQPRNFTLGLYKFKSTMGDSLPTDADLNNSIFNGLPGSSMPNFRLLSDEDRAAVVGYLKSLSPRFAEEKPGEVYANVEVPAFVGTKASVDQGAKLFAKRCQMCHGTKASRPDVKFMIKWSGDAVCNDQVRPADFTAGVIKRGTKVEDIFTSVTIGVENTSMIAFGKMLSDDDRWNLVSYILDFMGKGGKE